MDLEKFNTSEFSAFYEKTKQELSGIEVDFLKLEKEYFNLTPAFEKIFNRLQNLSRDCDEKKATLLKYRINFLYRDFLRFHHTSGYNAEAFHRLFRSLKNINSNLSDEIFSESGYKLIKEKIKSEARKWIPEGLPAKSSMHKFLAIKADDMRFLVPVRKKLWEKKVDYRKKLKIQIKSMPGDNTFVFHPLLALSSDSGTREGLAVLLELEDGNKYGILVDNIEGVMVFSDKFMNKYKDYFPVGEGNFQPFIKLKGERYFIRHPNANGQR